MIASAAADSEWVLNADWCLSSVASDDTIVDGEWVLARNPCSPSPFRLAGVFFHNARRKQTYAPLLHSSTDDGAPDPPAGLLISLPGAASICASSRGVVLARGPWSAYFISIPSSPKWARLPKPSRLHSPSLPIALAAAGDEYIIACAVPSADGPQGFYHFEIYASSTGAWRIVMDLFPAGDIVPFSGVSCGRTVYFQTATPSVAALDLASDGARVIQSPPRCWETDGRWRLAEVNGRLRCVCVTKSAVEVYELRGRDRWEKVSVITVELLTASASASASAVVPAPTKKWDGGEPIICKECPRPLRVQEEDDGVFLWVDGRVVRWDLEIQRAVCLSEAEAPPPGSGGDYVPYAAAANEGGDSA